MEGRAFEMMDLRIKNLSFTFSLRTVQYPQPWQVGLQLIQIVSFDPGLCSTQLEKEKRSRRKKHKLHIQKNASLSLPSWTFLGNFVYIFYIGTYSTTFTMSSYIQYSIAHTKYCTEQHIHS